MSEIEYECQIQKNTRFQRHLGGLRKDIGSKRSAIALIELIVKVSKKADNESGVDQDGIGANRLKLVLAMKCLAKVPQKKVIKGYI